MEFRINKVFFTRDRHPKDHCSFVEQGGPWPEHCVDGTKGFELHEALPVPKNAVVIDKGVCQDVDAYSGFDGTPLADELRRSGVKRTVVGGLATDYCVKATVLDSLKEGFETWLLTDAVAAVNVREGDGERAVLEMRQAGANLTDSGRMQTVLAHYTEPTALIVVDVQNDFCKGGALAVPNAERILGPLEKLLLACH